MLLLDPVERSPSQIVCRKRHESLGGAQFEHFAHLTQFLGEFACETLEYPASARTPLEKPEPAKAVEIVTDGPLKRLLTSNLFQI